MGKNGWQAVALIAIGAAALASAAAWNNKRALDVANAQLREPSRLELDDPAAERIARDVAARNAALSEIRRRRSAAAEAVKEQAGDRCVNGTRFRTVDGALTNVGTC